MFLGDVVLLGAIDANATASIVLVPLLLLGLGIGALASQLGSVTVSSVPDELAQRSAGSRTPRRTSAPRSGPLSPARCSLAVLTASFLTGIQNNPDVPSRVYENASTQLSGGIAFVSDADLRTALDDAHVSKKTTDAIVEENSKARLVALQAALGVVALVALLGLFCAGGIPRTQPKSAPKSSSSILSSSNSELEHRRRMRGAVVEVDVGDVREGGCCRARPGCHRLRGCGRRCADEAGRAVGSRSASILGADVKAVHRDIPVPERRAGRGGARRRRPESRVHTARRSSSSFMNAHSMKVVVHGEPWILMPSISTESSWR